MNPLARLGAWLARALDPTPYAPHRPPTPPYYGPDVDYDPNEAQEAEAPRPPDSLFDHPLKVWAVITDDRQRRARHAAEDAARQAERDRYWHPGRPADG